MLLNNTAKLGPTALSAYKFSTLAAHLPPMTKWLTLF